LTTTLCSETTVFPAVVTDVVRRAVENTLSSMGIQNVRGQPCSNDGSISGGVVGIISFLGDICWTFSVILPEATAPVLINKFTGFEIPFDSPDMGDVVGELANVVAGEIVAKLEAQKIKVQMSLPVIARGHDVEVMTSVAKPQARLEFQSEAGVFWCKLVGAKAGQCLGRTPGT